MLLTGLGDFLKSNQVSATMFSSFHGKGLQKAGLCNAA